MKTKQTIIMTTALIAIAAIGIAVLVLRGRGTATVSADETSVANKTAKKIPNKSPSIPARAKQAEAMPVKAVKPPRPDGTGTAVGENAGETPKAEGEDAGKKAKDDNPFPRYLDMFRNDPAALAAEFEKEAEADRVNQRKMRDWAIDKLKLNAVQATLFEKALDGIKSAVRQLTQDDVDLITSGQLNMDTAADGSLWNSNSLVMDQFVAARKKIVRDAAVELYNQLDIDSVSDAEKQRIIQSATLRTSFSYECLEPNLVVYDKVYKNMGVGNGIFSWCKRQRQKK